MSDRDLSIVGIGATLGSAALLILWNDPPAMVLWAALALGVAIAFYGTRRLLRSAATDSLRAARAASRLRLTMEPAGRSTLSVAGVTWDHYSREQDPGTELNHIQLQAAVESGDRVRTLVGFKLTTPDHPDTFMAQSFVDRDGDPGLRSEGSVSIAMRDVAWLECPHRVARDEPAVGWIGFILSRVNVTYGHVSDHGMTLVALFSDGGEVSAPLPRPPMRSDQ